MRPAGPLFALTLLLTACAQTEAEVRWTARYSPEVPYINRSNIAVTAFTTPDASSALVGSVQPGEGGFINDCTQDGEWCLITLPVLSTQGWVRMTAFFPSEI